MIASCWPRKLSKPKTLCSTVSGACSSSRFTAKLHTPYPGQCTNTVLEDDPPGHACDTQVVVPDISDRTPPARPEAQRHRCEQTGLRHAGLANDENRHR